MTARPQVAGALHTAWRYGRTSWAEVRAGQDTALRRLVLHAYHQVRYYQRLLDRHRLHPRHLRGAVDLPMVPASGPDELLIQPVEDLVACGVERSALIPASGTAGAGPRFRTRLEALLQLVHRTRALAALGVQSRDRIAMIGEGAGEWQRHGLALPLLGFGRRRVFGAGPSVAEVARFAPDVIVGSPVALDRLAHGASTAPLRPRLVLANGRPPMPRVRTRLRDAFGAPLLATYGLGTDTLLASECAATGAFHVADTWAVLEVLVHGRPALPGERGEIAVTLLHSYAMPVLRHRLGHLATRGGPCPCGAPFSTILAPDV